MERTACEIDEGPDREAIDAARHDDTVPRRPHGLRPWQTHGRLRPARKQGIVYNFALIHRRRRLARAGEQHDILNVVA
jgi:hypothetical protein